MNARAAITVSIITVSVSAILILSAFLVLTIVILSSVISLTGAIPIATHKR